MKVRTDFVTNSSSSSFVCIQIKSKKLKEMLKEHGVQYWDSNSKWDVFYKDEDVSCTADSKNNVEEILDWFMTDLLQCMNANKEYLDEYKTNRQMYLDDIDAAYYSIDTKHWGEFEGSEDIHDQFDYKKGKTNYSDKALNRCLKELKNYNTSDFLLGDRIDNSYHLGSGTPYAGKLHQLQTTGEAEITLVRDLNNKDDPNAIFVEEYPHKYMGVLWDRVTEQLAPLLDSGKYLYKAKVNSDTKRFSIDVVKAETQEDGWKKLKTGTPQITEDELQNINEAFDKWLIALKNRYEGKRKPTSVATLLKNGEETPAIVKEWAKILFNEDIEAVLRKEGLLNL